MRRLSVIIWLGLIISGCSGEKPINENRSQAESDVEDAVPSQQTEPREPKEEPELKFEEEQAKLNLNMYREQSFASTDDVIVGVIESFTVDSNNRIYIADRSQTEIYVFNPDGEYITSIGQQGRGPAEFSAISPNTTLQIHSNQLYVSDYGRSYNLFPDRLQVFNLDNDYSFSHTIILIANNRREFEEELAGYHPKYFYPRADGNLIVSYHRAPYDYKEEESFIRYMIQDSSAQIISGPILEQKDRTQLVYLVDNVPSPYNAITTFSFFGSSLFTVSAEGNIFTARTEEFTIFKKDTNGNLLDTIRHPFTNEEVTRQELIDIYEREGSGVLGDGVKVEMIQEADILPETWPALNNLLVDDENRLWVSTIVEDFDVYEWWILENSGEVITKFEWSRDKPIREVKNGYVYTLETEEETGLQTVVRYRVEMN